MDTHKKIGKKLNLSPNCSATSCRASILLFPVHPDTHLTVSQALMSSETGTRPCLWPPRGTETGSVMRFGHASMGYVIFLFSFLYLSLFQEEGITLIGTVLSFV